MIEPPNYLVKLIDGDGNVIGDRSITLPGIPRVGDDIRVSGGELLRVVRVIWEPNVGNWVEVHTATPRRALLDEMTRAIEDDGRPDKIVRTR